MKRTLGLLMAMALLVPAVFAGVVEDWTSMQAGMTGPYQDSNGSKIDFAVVAGPSGSDKALQITSNKVSGGYCGVYHNVSADLSKSGSFKFKAKSTVPGEVQMAISDAYKVQYVAKFAVTTAWTDVEVPLASFIKDPYYTPPDAVLGHPMDLSKTGNTNFSPQMDGPAVLLIGPISSAGSASAAPAAKPAAAAPAAKPAAAAPAATGPGLSKPVVIQDFADLDNGSAGAFQDTQGSKIEYSYVDKKGGKYLKVTYSLVGDYCGMWCRAGGSDWSGVSAAGAKNLYFKIYSKQSIALGFALKDKNNNQYSAEAPASKGGSWETIVVPLDSFILDPYYTPPDAVKGAAKDFSTIKQFNIQPKTKGEKITFAIDGFSVK